MELTVQDIYDLNDGLAVINQEDLPTKVAFKLQKITLELSKEYDAAQSVRQKIIKKYQEKVLDNGNVRIKKDKLDVYRKEIKELMEQEVKVKLEKVGIDELELPTIKPNTLILLDKIIKESDK